MKLFEIHITGKSDLILKEFENLGLKTLKIILLDKQLQNVGFEHMCCIQKKFKTYEECQEYVDNLLLKLKSEVVRVKIESAYYKEYLDKAIYAETHFTPYKPGKFPTVRNIKSKKYVSTFRTYNKKYFEMLKNSSVSKRGEFELCLYDSNPKFDDYWLSFYK